MPSTLFQFTLPPDDRAGRTPENVAGLVGRRAHVDLTVWGTGGAPSPDPRNGTIRAAELGPDGALVITVALD